MFNADCEPVRTTRARIIRLKNDYKDLMSRIEKGLHEHHARLAEQAQNDSAAASQAQAGQSAPPAALEAPFAKVNSVVAGSPADDAGLRAGDTITKFGWVDWTNHERLGRVAEAVSQNEGVSTQQPRSALLAALQPYKATICKAWHQEHDKADSHADTNYGQSFAAQQLWWSGRDCTDAAYTAAKLGRTRLVGLPSAASVACIFIRLLSLAVETVLVTHRQSISRQCESIVVVGPIARVMVGDGQGWAEGRTTAPAAWRNGLTQRHRHDTRRLFCCISQSQ